MYNIYYIFYTYKIYTNGILLYRIDTEYNYKNGTCILHGTIILQNDKKKIWHLREYTDLLRVS